MIRLALLLALGAALTTSGLGNTPRDARDALQAHNRWRARHQAPPLAWSDELARYAQAWAENLATRHPGRLIHSDDGSGPIPEARALGYGDWGENLYWSSAVRFSDGTRRANRELTAADVVDAWASEARSYDFATGRCSAAGAEGCGHFTQVVWKETLRVGCGSAFGADSAQVWACSYDPPGNWDGEYVRNVAPTAGR